jgi:hypothetical protein
LSDAINFNSGNSRLSDGNNVGRHCILLSPPATGEGIADPRGDKVRVTGMKLSFTSHEKVYDKRAFWIRLAILETATHADRYNSLVTATAITKKQLAANPPMIGDAHGFHFNGSVAPQGQRPQGIRIRQVEHSS